MTADWRFGPDYDERLELADGRRIRLRAIRPDDREKMREGLARLSPESRYRRFFTDKRSLTDAELDYLTEPDGVSHFAFVAGEIDEEGNEGLGAGVARFVADPNDPTVAEPAIVVVDEFQGQGLGRAFMDRLIACAAERGIERFRSEVLARNAPMLTMLEDIAPGRRGRPESGVVICEFPVVHEVPEGEAPHPSESLRLPVTRKDSRAMAPFDFLLRAVAEGRAELARRVALTEHWLGAQIFGAAAEDDAPDDDEDGAGDVDGTR